MQDSHEKSAVVRILEIILSQTHLAKEYPGMAQQFADKVGLDIERTLALVIASQIVNEFGLDPDDETIGFTF
jgi:DNA polymerase II small subunit/DNA polymerase delta subunit B